MKRASRGKRAKGQVSNNICTYSVDRQFISRVLPIAVRCVERLLESGCLMSVSLLNRKTGKGPERGDRLPRLRTKITRNLRGEGSRWVATRAFPRSTVEARRPHSAIGMRRARRILRRTVSDQWDICGRPAK